MPRLLSALHRVGHRVTAIPTRGPGSAGSIAQESVARGADLVLAAGGDGTINEVAGGMVGSSTPLGILPAGTANVLANELGIGLDPERAVAGLSHFEPQRIPVGRLHNTNGSRQSRYFVLMAGVGLDAHIVYNLSLPLKAKLGKLAYWLAGFSVLGRKLAEFEVQVNGYTVRCSFALISRVRNYGGDLEIARGVHLLDDTFEVVLFEGRSTLRYVRYLAGVATNRLSGMQGVSILRSSRVLISESADARVYVQVDGEYYGHLPASVELVPDALTLLAPTAYWRRSRSLSQAAGAPALP